MQISELRRRVTDALVEFAWAEWGQMGVSAAVRQVDGWSQDPEALLGFTLHVARGEPRLFDELLDWLRLNGDLVSGRRISRLAQRDEERALVGAAVEWAADHGSPLRVAPRQDRPGKPQLVFPKLRPPSRTDEAFRRNGFLKAPTKPSNKSARPDTTLPINFAFRLRQLFGIGARAEIVRFLLTTDAPTENTQAIADAALSVKRNVNDALNELVAAGQLARRTTGNVAWYSLDRERWANFLGLDESEIPTHRDWPRILWVLIEIDRWLNDPDNEILDDYLRASEARRLMDGLDNSLARAGIAIVRHGHGADFWPSFVTSLELILATLRHEGPEVSPVRRRQ